MKTIKPKKVLFIKLGKGGEFEKECIENSQTIRLDYKETDHRLCIKGEWSKINTFFFKKLKTKDHVASYHTNQIRYFYEADENTLWVTFYANQLWWCFAKPEVKQLPDKTKIRKVIGKWSNKDINGNELGMDIISGKLLKVQGFRGTICTVKENEYAVSKINAEVLPEVREAKKAFEELKGKLSLLIKNTQWKEFEVLIDLIFRQAGWQRVSAVGKMQKTLDLELFAPVTAEKAIVQIKAESDLKEFERYKKEFANFGSFDKFFYVVHTPKGKLARVESDPKINLFFADKVAELTISSGLTEWVMKRAS